MKRVFAWFPCVPDIVSTCEHYRDNTQACVTEGYLYDGAIMITASHLPAHRNGFKFFTKSGGLNKQDIAEVLLPVPFSEEGLLRGTIASPYPPKICTMTTSVPQCSHALPVQSSSYILHAVCKYLRGGFARPMAWVIEGHWLWIDKAFKVR